MTDLFGDICTMTFVPRPSEPIVRSALVEDGCRFWLKRAWGAGPCILWAMCNPSDANAQRDDPTMRRVMEFSLRWGFGSCVVINPIPVISSTPAQALEWVNNMETMELIPGDTIWEQWNSNIYHCVHAIWSAQTHIAAWGNNVDPWFIDGWLQAIAESPETPPEDDEDIKPIKWLCLGTNSNGSPRHPLSRGKNRVPADFKPIPWNSSQVAT